MLKKERKDGESFVAQHKRLLGHVHSLPPEIVLVVFRYRLDESLHPDIPWSYTLHGPGKPVPWVLSEVCPRWRSILRESPSLWSSFSVHSRSNLSFLEEALQLSRHVPLHFNLYLPDDTVDDTRTRALAKHVDRWESVRIDVPQDTFISLDHLGHMPMLKKLSISLERLGHSNVVDLTGVLSRFGYCPQLAELCITMPEGDSRNIPVHLQTTAISWPWANLSKISLTFGYSTHPSDVLHSLLVACVNLRQLDVVCFDCGFEDGNYAQLSHSGITSLTLENPPTLLISHISYPALTHLCFQYMDPDTVHSFISQHPRSISHFKLILYYDTDALAEPWDSVLEVLPDVVHLTLRLESETLHHSPTPKSVLKSLVDIPLPSLRTLSIDVSCHLLKFCACPDIIPLLASTSRTWLQRFEIYSERCDGNNWGRTFLKVPALRGVEMHDIPSAVSQMIEESTMIKALLGFKEEGLEVSINGIPLTDRSATLYM